VERHRLAEERSLAYHRAIAEKMTRDPGVLTRARARVAAWLTPPPPHYARGWDIVLARPVADIVRFLVDEGEMARELRQSTPFAGELPPRERWRLWREVGDRARGAA
jgi:hypothetical protein